MKEKNYQLSNNLVEYSQRAKILEKDEEYNLITKWQSTKDQKALQKILNSYMRLAVSFARKFKNYGISQDDLIHEGILGIIHALNKFDTQKGFRLSTYASWWIRASIQEFILKNWSIVRTGSSASQKSLFFNLKKIKQKISENSIDFMGQKEINQVSKILNVKSIDVQNMESRLTSGDLHLNQTIDDENGNDLMSVLPDDSPSPEKITEDHMDSKTKTNWIMSAINTLSEREKIIIKSRKLKEKSSTLDELGVFLKISKERVRQIETRALEKLKKTILKLSQEDKEFFI